MQHAVALLFEIEAGKDFPIGEIPEDILEKRVKKEARERKAEQAAEEREGKSGIQDSGEGRFCRDGEKGRQVFQSQIRIQERQNEKAEKSSWKGWPCWDS